MSRAFLIAICLLAAAISAHSVSEEQAAQHSWYQQYIGKAKQVLFAFKGRDRCFVSTEANALASLDLRDGEIVWRQTYLDNDSVDRIALVPKPAAVVSLSQQGQTLRAWHAGDGALLWENFFGSRSEAGADGLALKVLPDVTGDGSSDIAVLSHGKLLVSSFPVLPEHTGSGDCLRVQIRDLMSNLHQTHLFQYSCECSWCLGTRGSLCGP